MKIIANELSPSSSFLNYSLDTDWAEWSDLRCMIRMAMLRDEVRRCS